MRSDLLFRFGRDMRIRGWMVSWSVCWRNVGYVLKVDVIGWQYSLQCLLKILDCCNQ